MFTFRIYIYLIAMKKKILLFGLSIFFSLSVVFAQDKVTGHWTGKVMDQYNIIYDFQVHGDTLTGKDTHFDGSVSDISNGKIAGDSISFDVPIQGELTHVIGKLTETGLALSFSVQGYDIVADLKKSE